MRRDFYPNSVGHVNGVGFGAMLIVEVERHVAHLPFGSPEWQGAAYHFVRAIVDRTARSFR